MPIFEYICRECGSAFEAIVPNESAEVRCRKCDSGKVEKQLSVFAVAGGNDTASVPAAGPCGSCGAARQGMCQMMN